MAQYLSRETIAWVKQFYGEAAGNGSDVDQERHNHLDCPAGTDTRQRLYTKVTEDNSKILCHCFNCGASGVVPLRPTIALLAAKSAEVVTPDYAQWHRAVHTYDAATVPTEGEWLAGREKVWPYRWVLDYHEYKLMEEREWYGMRHNGTWWMTPRGTTGFDFRQQGPKRMDRVFHPLHKGDSPLLVYNSHNSDKAVICEDALSAMKVDLAGLAGVALCCSSLSQDDAFKLSMRFKKMVVWLDNDNTEVRTNARIAHARLKLYCDQVGINPEDLDPKKYSVTSIGWTAEHYMDNA